MRATRNLLTSIESSQTAILGILCLGVFSTALDQTVVVAALPSVMVDLEIPLTDLDMASWIVTGYLVSYTVAMPLAGRLSDVYGRVRMFQAALVLFSIGSALVAVAPDFSWIVSARVIQAFGGGATVPIGLAMAVAAVSPEKRGIAIGLVAASAEAGSVLGPLYGGAIIEWIGWRWIFWLDIPPELHPDRAYGDVAEPRQPRSQDGLFRCPGFGRSPHRSYASVVPEKHLFPASRSSRISWRLQESFSSSS